MHQGGATSGNRHHVAVLLLLSLTLPVSARIWFVEKDGSGDFTVIQDAVDASAAGDTIRIGPGRFTDWRLFQSVDGWMWNIVTTPHDLTFIGAGQAETILGAEVPTYFHEGKQINAFLGRGLDATVHVSDLRIEHVMDAFNYGKRLYLSHVTTSDLRRSIVLLTLSDGLDIEDCTFIEPVADTFSGTINHSFDGRIVDVAIRRSRFVGGNTNINLPNARLVLEDSVFEDTHGPVCWAAGTAEIRRCVFVGPELLGGIWIDGGVSATITDCVVHPAKGVNLTVGLGAQAVGERNVFHGSKAVYGEDTIVLGSSGTNLVLRNCDILRQPQTRFSVFNGSTTHDIDLRWNFWGTTEPESLSVWIRDRTDCQAGPDCRTTYVIYEPYLEHSVPTRRSSVSALKALFGGD